MSMIWVKIAIVLLGLIAVFMTFKAELIVDKIFHKEAEPRLVMRVKYAALALVAVVCILTFIFN